MKPRLLLTTTAIILAACGNGSVEKGDTEITITYSYDELNRLVTVSRSDGPVIDYQHDVVSNITQTSVTSSPDSDGDGIADFVEADLPFVTLSSLESFQ